MQTPSGLASWPLSIGPDQLPHHPCGLLLGHGRLRRRRFWESHGQRCPLFGLSRSLFWLRRRTEGRRGEGALLRRSYFALRPRPRGLEGCLRSHDLGLVVVINRRGRRRVHHADVLPSHLLFELAIIISHVKTRISTGRFAGVDLGDLPAVPLLAGAELRRPLRLYNSTDGGVVLLRLLGRDGGGGGGALHGFFASNACCEARVSLVFERGAARSCGLDCWAVGVRSAAFAARSVGFWSEVRQLPSLLLSLLQIRPQRSAGVHAFFSRLSRSKGWLDSPRRDASSVWGPPRLSQGKRTHRAPPP